MFALVSISIEMMGHVCVLLVFNAIDEFSQSIFCFVFGLSYIFAVVPGAFNAIYYI